MSSYRRRMLLLTCAAALASTAALQASAQQSGRPGKHAKKPAAAKTEAAAPVGNPKPSLRGQYEAWGAYTATPSGHKICFVLGRPSSSKSEPANRPRDPAFAYLATRPADRVKEELSVLIGYQFKPSSEASLAVGPARFAMYTQKDSAWLKQLDDAPRLLDAMRKGSDMVIKGASEHGTQTTDTFSLKGISQALDRAAQECK